MVTIHNGGNIKYDTFLSDNNSKLFITCHVVLQLKQLIFLSLKKKEPTDQKLLGIHNRMFLA